METLEDGHLCQGSNNKQLQKPDNSLNNELKNNINKSTNYIIISTCALTAKLILKSWLSSNEQISHNLKTLNVNYYYYYYYYYYYDYYYY